MDTSRTGTPKAHWDEHYGERERVWSGRVNALLAEIAAPLTPGKVLDLGCGEGADAMWLAEQGWHVVAVDISDTALERARADTNARGLGECIEFQSHDLSESFPAGTFDLVSAQFLHSTLPLDRMQIFRRAAAVIGPSGLLVIVDHAGAPPWASKLHHHHEFPSADEVLDSLSLPAAEWNRLRVEAVEREATGPNGETGMLLDNVIVLRRRSSY